MFGKKKTAWKRFDTENTTNDVTLAKLIGSHEKIVG